MYQLLLWYQIFVIVSILLFSTLSCFGTLKQELVGMNYVLINECVEVLYSVRDNFWTNSEPAKLKDFIWKFVLWFN